MTQWQIFPYDPVPWHVKPNLYPALGRFGLLIGVIEWGFTMILGTYSRRSISRMPVNWRNNLVELNNARYEAEKRRKEHRKAQENAK